MVKNMEKFKFQENGFAIAGKPDEGAVQQMHRCLSDGRAKEGALMADHHLGYSMPVGGVIAYENAVSPSGVGFDIGCGNVAMRTGFKADSLRKNIGSVMDKVYHSLSFGIGRKNKETPEGSLIDLLWEDQRWKDPLPKKFRQLAEQQLGTIGSGNHYVDLFTDELDQVWIGVHFGSRGFGHKIATHFLKKGGYVDDMHSHAVVFDLNSSIGEEYWRAMELAGHYAMAGRDWVSRKVASLLHTGIHQVISNHHNFAWKETINGEERVVIRKGATPNYPGQLSFIGGSMGTNSYVLEGVYEETESDLLLNSTVHGAGRKMGRRQAKGKSRWAALSRISNGDLKHLRENLSPEQEELIREYEIGGEIDRKIEVLIRPGLVSQDMMNQAIMKAQVELRGAGTDESPHCYKDIQEVLKNQGSTVKIVHTLKPVGVAMAGHNEYDPFKD